MKESASCTIQSYNFNRDLLSNFKEQFYSKEFWPVVYILSDNNIKEAYVGETTDIFNRMSQHLQNDNKNKLTVVRVVSSEKFNKSATLDIESNLIKYISGDGQYKLLNANLGLTNHNYFQKKEIYSDIFKVVWNKLKKEKLVNKSIEEIDNSDLFKYSPYKTLTGDQKNSLLQIIDYLAKGNNNILIQGGAGTGKSVLAVFLFKLLNTDLNDFNFKELEDEELELIKGVNIIHIVYPNLKMGLVVPMASFRKTLKKIFKNTKGLNAKMVISPSEATRGNYDILMVDEAHRLRRRVNLGTYFGIYDAVSNQLGLNKAVHTELDWLMKKSKSLILLYDQKQTIKPSDVLKEDFARKTTRFKKMELRSQLRVKGGTAYVKYVDKLLSCSLKPENKINEFGEYEFKLFDSIKDLKNAIKDKEQQYQLCRIVAGYSWEWISNKRKELFDISIDGVELRWNTESEDWVNSPTAPEEVGCIHTTQGYDLNYTGVIFGKEITYDKINKAIVILKENYFDKNGKNSIKNPAELKEFILNIYNTLMLRGIRGTYIYACDPLLQEYLKYYVSRHLEKY